MSDEVRYSSLLNNFPMGEINIKNKNKIQRHGKLLIKHYYKSDEMTVTPAPKVGL